MSAVPEPIWEASALTSADWPGLPIRYEPAFGGHDRAAGKASAVVARRILADITGKRVQPGDRLPLEAEMLGAYGVSRDTLREALRILEQQGVLEIRRGPGGGPFIAPVNAAYLGRTSTLHFHLAGATYEEVFDAWEHLEPMLAARIARRGDRDEVRAALQPFAEGLPRPLSPAVSASASSEELFDAATGFHGVLSSLADNRVLILLSQAVEHVVTERITEDLDPIDAQTTIEHDHRALATAIIRGHANRAEELAAQHIRNIRTHFETVNRGRGNEIVAWR